jgi:hypothetical protein
VKKGHVYKIYRKGIMAGKFSYLGGNSWKKRSSLARTTVSRSLRIGEKTTKFRAILTHFITWVSVNYVIRSSPKVLIVMYFTPHEIDEDVSS